MFSSWRNLPFPHGRELVLDGKFCLSQGKAKMDKYIDTIESRFWALLINFFLPFSIYSASLLNESPSNETRMYLFHYPLIWEHGCMHAER